jgi:hypothetical protein
MAAGMTALAMGMLACQWLFGIEQWEAARGAAGSSGTAGAAGSAADLVSCEPPPPSSSSGACEYFFPPASDTPDWHCLEPDSGLPQVAPFTVFRGCLIDISQLPVAGARLDVCGVLNPACPRPKSCVESAQNGAFEVTIDNELGEFLRVTADLDGEPSARSLWASVSTAQEVTLGDVTLLSPAQFQALLEAFLGATEPVPGTGQVLISAHDCALRAAAGVSFSTDRGGQAWYTSGNFPTATEQTTSERGGGGILDVPEGFVTVTASSDGRVVSAAEAYVTAGEVTYVALFPAFAQRPDPGAGGATQ